MPDTRILLLLVALCIAPAGCNAIKAEFGDLADSPLRDTTKSNRPGLNDCEGHRKTCQRWISDHRSGDDAADCDHYYKACHAVGVWGTARYVVDGRPIDCKYWYWDRAVVNGWPTLETAEVSE